MARIMKVITKEEYDKLNGNTNICEIPQLENFIKIIQDNKIPSSLLSPQLNELIAQQNAIKETFPVPQNDQRVELTSIKEQLKSPCKHWITYEKFKQSKNSIKRNQKPS